MSESLLPLPRYSEEHEFMPSVHYTLTQYVVPRVGDVRQIYDFELIYVIRGELRVHFEHETMPDRMQSGDLALLRPAIKHRIELIAKPSTLLLGVHFDYFNEFKTLPEQKLVVQDGNPGPEHFCREPVTKEGVPIFQNYYPNLPLEGAKWLEMLADEFASARPGFAMACRGLFLQLFTLLCRLHDSPRHLHSEYRDMVIALANNMEAALEHSWSNCRMARQIGVSEDHFIRIFRDIVGMSPHRFLQTARHREAKRLLRETPLPVELIGQSLKIIKNPLDPLKS